MIAAIICIHTSERWPDICEAVASLRRQTLPAREIVIVVDHNAELLARAQRAFPDLTVVANREGRGLSGARNTGIAVSSAPLLAFLDDDAVADRGLLAQLARCCRQENVMGAVARIEPLWRGQRPGWLPEEFLWTVGCSYRGLPATTAEVRNVLGAAMMIRREVFERVGGFSPQVGRSGGRIPMSCEETELCIRARAAFPRGCFMFERTALSWHKVPAARLNWRYFSLRCYAEGLSKAYVASLAKGHRPLATEARYVTRTLPAGVASGLRRRDADGIKRALAIALGLGCAGIGFAVGKVRPAMPTASV